jgi:hypothetical protein
VLHLIRDPRGFFASEKAKRVSSLSVCDQNLMIRSAKLWRDSYDNARHIVQGGADNFLIIRYEDVVRSVDKTMHRVAEFLGLEFSEILLYPTYQGKPWSANTSFAAPTESSGELIEDSVAHWKRILLLQEKLWLEWQLSEPMLAIGYTSILRTRLLSFMSPLLFLAYLACGFSTSTRRMIKNIPGARALYRFLRGPV